VDNYQTSDIQRSRDIEDALTFKDIQVVQVGNERMIESDGTIYMSELQMISVLGLEVDTYHPPLSEIRARRIAEGFEPIQLQAITVSVREDGRRFVVDGQHRLSAVKMRFGPSAQIPAWVHRDLDRQGEADLFLKINQNRRSHIRLSHAFHAMLAAGYENPTLIAKVLSEFGLVVVESSTGRRDGVGAVRDLLRIFDLRGQTGLRQVFRVITSAWPVDPQRFGSPIALCLAHLFVRYPDASEERMISALSKTTARSIITMMREYQAFRGRATRGETALYPRGHRMVEPALDILRREYNKGLRVNRLEG